MTYLPQSVTQATHAFDPGCYANAIMRRCLGHNKNEARGGGRSSQPRDRPAVRANPITFERPDDKGRGRGAAERPGASGESASTEPAAGHLSGHEHDVGCAGERDPHRSRADARRAARGAGWNRLPRSIARLLHGSVHRRVGPRPAAGLCAAASYAPGGRRPVGHGCRALGADLAALTSVCRDGCRTRARSEQTRAGVLSRGSAVRCGHAGATRRRCAHARGSRPGSILVRQ